MKIPRDIEELMRRLGLTSNEIKVYMLLLNSGPLTAKDISDYAEVPFSKIYLVLKSLENKGWISSIRDRPIRYVALSPNEAVKKAKIYREREWEEAANKIIPALQPIYEARVVPETPEIWIVRGEENISSKIMDLILKSQYELLMAIHAKLDPLFERAFLFERISSLHIPSHVRVLVPRGLLDEVDYFTRLGAELRYRDNMFGGGVISDAKEALLILGETDRVNTAIWSTHTSLIYLAKLYFEKLWESSEKVEV
jgi:sugar-specific transcriptional regulator TrmB